MTPRKLLERKPVQVSHEISYLSNGWYDFVPEAYALSDIEVDESDCIEIRVFGEFYFDDRRSWTLAAVYFDGKPVMITQSAGREGKDHTHKFVLDQSVYMDLVHHLNSLPHETSSFNCEGCSVVSMDEELGSHLTKFYCGYDLDHILTLEQEARKARSDST